MLQSTKNGLRQLLVVGDRVLIKAEEPEERTEVGLYLPQTVVEKEKVQSGRIVSVGPGIPVPDPGVEDEEPWKTSDRRLRFIPMQAEEGDFALFLKKSAIEIGSRASIVIRLSSQNTTSLPSRRWPASEARLGSYPLHDVAVRCDHPGSVVHDFVTGSIEAGGEVTLGHGHSDRVAESLTERAGCRLDPRGQVRLGMARCQTAPLSKVPNVVQRELVPTHVQERVLKHRCVPAGQNEAVPVSPRGGGRIVASQAGKKQPTQRGQRHRGAGVARVGGLDGVHTQTANRFDGKLIELPWVPHNVGLLLTGAGSSRTRQ